MLVLSRQKEEAIVFGLRDFAQRILAGEVLPEEVDDVRLVVVDTRSDKCRLGIKAHRQLSVHRLEVVQAIERQAKSDAA